MPLASMPGTFTGGSYMRTFTPHEVVEFAGLGSYDTLDYWATTGFLKPSFADNDSAGSHRRYSFADLVAARVAVLLSNEGMNRRALRRIIATIKRLKDHTERPMASARLILCGRDMLVVYDREEMLSVLSQDGSEVLRCVVELEPVCREIRGAIGGIRNSP